MLDKLLEIGSTPDLITPLWAMIQDVINGPAYHLHVHQACGMSANQIAAKLKSKGVRTWGVQIVDRWIVISVRKPQARYAEYWLRRWRL